MRRPIFLPEQDQGHALALQFGGNTGPVGFLTIPWWTAHPLEKGTLKRRVIVQAWRHRRGHPAGAS